jgi:hypothetical protein
MKKQEEVEFIDFPDDEPYKGPKAKKWWEKVCRRVSTKIQTSILEGFTGYKSPNDEAYIARVQAHEIVYKDGQNFKNTQNHPNPNYFWVTFKNDIKFIVVYILYRIKIYFVGVKNG